MRDRIRRDRGSGGFTLIELLITIVIIGILAAVVVLAIGGLTNTGASSACNATKDAAEAAAVAFYSDHSTSNPVDATPWPTDFTELVPTYMDARDGVTTGATLSHGSDWTLSFASGGSTAQPTFACT